LEAFGEQIPQYGGGIASVMPGTRSVASDFSIINWTKSPHSKFLTDFSFRSNSSLQTILNVVAVVRSIIEIIDKVWVTLILDSFSVTLTLKDRILKYYVILILRWKSH
jgi:hypothetical protein